LFFYGDIEMKMKIVYGVLGLASLVAASLANASSVSVNPAVVNTVPGGVFSASIGGDFSDVVGGVSEGAFQLSWDTTLLSLQSSSTTGTDITNILTNQFVTTGNAGFTFTQLDAAAGTLNYSFTLCPLGAACDFASVFSMLNVTFDVNPAAVGITSADVGISFLGNFGADGVAVTAPTFNPATISIAAVPVPAAVWLFGSGLLGLVGVARRRQILAA
jgi:hypothetical protein